MVLTPFNTFSKLPPQHTTWKHLRSEDSAYKELADSRPINKSRKLLNRSGLLKNNQVSTPNKPVLKKPEMKKMDITTKTIRPVAKKSVKLLRV